MPDISFAQITVCQTQAFWCSFPGNYPSGQLCHCNSFMGPLPGYTINPNTTMNPGRSNPLPGDEEDEEEVDLSSEQSDCLNGLGNCSGSFKSLAKKKKPKRSRQ